MSAQNIILWVVGILVIVGAGYFLISGQTSTTGSMEGDTMMEEGDPMEKDDAMKEDDAMMEKDDGAMMEKGTYEAYAPEKLALASAGKVILYFHAGWCPICRGIEREIEAAPEGIPSGVHILKIDYDKASALKQKYGVTYQHTFVQVDEDGNQIAKWGDATTLAQVISKIR